ncbi:MULTISPECIES: L-threonylcarbamoyladenylate synthase [unclassified Lentimonas]|uniref:L-threonylcarbamoyladenylate synthase n=1 Tax=unclassified Lentimonas TaxID=2630993 RepID=UPI00132A196F|nr:MULTISPECIES: L-threonylcarbamoyladenylate synthase [unclassified Lentimonas]CAA6679482.1 TsaC protein (YrdC-Sua5 domains) required for threonylcarbamoyladenosine t(6)A37 modification in tRNA [Lentimonas sp. CC4]CAA6687153.1 TsaC protein (YrdC-Sua5 domains) required for threonylcarbamoyladenosine t(6)A37 modification in tRNA [Lentimonas sp. CC6]CAA7075500.1 TsaC protein (YrdC-Sua5 domains) required for threonylcarbamoyladenosine t(6)A37 modification in tRNA [Lentimonas sp. CC4]CAA7170267.1 T
MDHSSKVLETNTANLDLCAELLRSGEVVGMPTETVYGLAGNALNEASVRKIFDVKGRPLIDPLIVHFSNLEDAEIHIESSDSVRELAAAFWPGPLTMVVPKKGSIPDIVTAGLPSVAIRVPQHPTFRSILERLDFPLAAPSANPFGYVSPTLANHVAHTLGSRIQAVLDGGSCAYGLESTIIDLRTPKAPIILRHGPITEAQINETLNVQVATKTATSDDGSAQSAPGLLTKHYSPNTRVTLLPHGQAITCNTAPSRSIALIANKKPEWHTGQPNIFWLSESGDLNDIAHNLFELIQRLDQQNFEQMWIEQADHIGLGQAINDRLCRAAAKFGA